jgi:hypothetical protein
MQPTTRTIARFAAVIVAVATVGAACSSDDTDGSAAPDEPATSSPAPATTGAVTLTEQITADFQGVQLDVIGDTAQPGSTTMFFQEGTQAAVGTWKSADEWCHAEDFDWSVTDATSPDDFTVRYVRTDAHPECLAPAGDERFTLHITGRSDVDGRTVYDGTYRYPNGATFPTTRTVCGATVDDPDRCGVDTPGLGVPTVEAG